MKKYLSFICMLFATALSAAQLKVLNYTFTAKTLQEGTDPGFKKLTDGKINSDKSKERFGKVLWQHNQNGKKPPVITFNFETPVKIDDVKIHYFRWHRSYGIKDIRAVGITEKGERLPLGNVVLNHPYTKPKKDPYNMSAAIKSADSTPVTSVEVIFSATGGYLSLNEIEFFGTALPKPKAALSLQSNPLDKLAKQAKPGFRLYREGALYVMENDKAIYSIDPLYSGALNYAYDKLAKKNLIAYSAPGSGFGPLFNDRFWPGNYAVRDMYRYISYKAEILADTPELKQIKMTGVGKSGFYANVTIAKTYTLERDSSSLRCEYSITNGLDNVVPLDKGFWTYGGVAGSGNLKRLVPGLSGVESYSSAIKTVAIRDFSSNWYGEIDGDKGIAVLTPWERMKEIQFWGDVPFVGTLECRLGIYPIPAGKSLNFTMGLALFDKVGIPDHVNEFAAGGFNLNSEYATIPEQFEFSARLFKTGKYKIEIAGAVMNKGKYTLKTIKSVNASSDYTKVAFAPLKAQGTQVYRAQISNESGKLLFTAYASTVMVKNSGMFLVPLPGSRIPDQEAAQAKLNLDFHSTACASPHINWGKPYAGGKLKVLAINSAHGGIRDMIEMAQRYDIELTTNYIAGLWSLCGHVRSLSIKSCVNELARQLKKNYDVIIVSSGAWELIDKNLSHEILKKVENGTGLVLVGPKDLPKELAKYIVPARKNQVAVSPAWENTSALLTGVPLEILPAGRILLYSKFGTVLAKAGKYPLVGTFNYGKGKVCALSYLTEKPNGSGGKYNRTSTFFLPLLNYEPGPLPQYHYWEYQSLLLARMLFAAGNKASAVNALSYHASADGVKATLKSSKACKVALELTLRNKFSDTVGSLKHNAELKPGENEINLVLPALTMNGLHFADLIVRSEKGVEWFGSAVFTHQTSAKIVKVSCENRVYKKEEKLPVSVKIEGDGKVMARLYDTFGNEFARAEGTELSILLTDCRTPVCRMAVELLDGKDKVIDRAMRRIELYQKPDVNRFNIAQGWPGVGGHTQLAFADTYLAQLRKFGVNCTSSSNSSRDSDAVERAIRDNNITYLSVTYDVDGHGVGSKYPFNTKLKPKSKFDLVRKPCLSKPGFKESLRKGPKFGFAWKYGAITVPGPDEANMISEWDGCFSPDCQKAFREYLKKQYPSLQALNESWECNFKSWDEVIALTASEARQKKSFAGWLDHRTFNDWNRADAFAHLVSGIEKLAPGLPYSLSGTSETNAWNAWDYYLLMPHLKALSAYTGEQTIQQRSMAPHKVKSMPWIGYDSDFDSCNRTLIFSLMNGATGSNIYGNFNIEPDFQISERGKDLIRAFDIYRRGPAEAVMRTDYYFYPIAFHYTPASIKLDWIIGMNEQRKSSIAGFRHLVADAGLTYDYVGYGELEKSGIPAKYKVFVLPMSVALSDKEAEAVKNFVKNGGIVLADFLTGSYNQHGKPRKNPVLQELFGIRSKGNWTKGKYLFKGANELNGAEIPCEFLENGLTTTTAKVIGAVDGKPAAFVNQYGKGKAFYFGCNAMGTYGDWQEMRFAKAHKTTTKVMNQLAGAIYHEKKITPAALAPTLLGTTLQCRMQKNALFLGVIRDIAQTQRLNSKPERHTIKLAKKAHIYDLLEHRYLGFGDKIEKEFAPATQSIFVMLPYKAEKLELKRIPGGVEMKLLADTAKYTDHLFYVELIDPKGKSNPAFEDVVLGRGNSGIYSFRKPLNAMPGKWKLRVTEILTSQKADFTL